MIVYEFRHEIYAWEDCETTVNTLLFETKDDAIEYLNIKKPDIVREYCNQLDLPDFIDTLRQYIETSETLYSNHFTDENDYFYVALEEYGHDELSIEKKEILKFK